MGPEHTEKERPEKCEACLCEERFIDGFCENRCQGKNKIQEEMDKNKEFLRVNRPFSGARAILCIWCGEAVLYADSKTPPENLIEQMREHDEGCGSSPLVKKIKALQSQISTLQEKAKEVCVGDLEMPPFDDIDIFTNKKMNSTPELAYLMGFETGVLVCGEILSKPIDLPTGKDRLKEKTDERKDPEERKSETGTSKEE